MVAERPEGEVLLTLWDFPLRPPIKSGTASPFRGRICAPSNGDCAGSIPGDAALNPNLFNALRNNQPHIP